MCEPEAHEPSLKAEQRTHCSCRRLCCWPTLDSDRDRPHSTLLSTRPSTPLLQCVAESRTNRVSQPTRCPAQAPGKNQLTARRDISPEAGIQVQNSGVMQEPE